MSGLVLKYERSGEGLTGVQLACTTDEQKEETQASFIGIDAYSILEVTRNETCESESSPFATGM